jgi:hypothetical protein
MSGVAAAASSNVDSVAQPKKWTVHGAAKRDIVHLASQITTRLTFLS